MANQKPPVLPTWGEGMHPTDTHQPPNTEIIAGWPHSDIAPPRQYFNWFFNWVMGGVRYLCSRGLPDWDAAETYGVGATVIGDNGKVYRSKVANNINHKPSGSSGQWKLAFYETDEADARFAPKVQTANGISALQQKDTQHDASLSAHETELRRLDSVKFDKAGGPVSGAINMPASPTNGTGPGYKFDADTGMTSPGEGALDMFLNSVRALALRLGGGGQAAQQQMVLNDPNAGTIGIGFMGATAGSLRLRNGIFEFVNPDGSGTMKLSVATTNAGVTSTDAVNAASLINYAHHIQGAGQIGLRLGSFLLMSGYEAFPDVSAGTVSRKTISVQGYAFPPTVFISWGKPEGIGAGSQLNIWYDNVSGSSFQIAAEEPSGGTYVQVGGVSWCTIGIAS